jgi:hypothetical protein
MELDWLKQADNTLMGLQAMAPGPNTSKAATGAQDLSAPVAGA